MLITIVENFLLRHRMAATLFGREVAQDPRLVSDLRAGRAPRAPLDQRVRGFIDGYELATPARRRPVPRIAVMTLEAMTPRIARRSAPRSTADRLREALLALGDHRGQVLMHSERAWASITFAGARHTLTLLFAGEEAVDAGERFLAALPDHEFAIPGQLVADAAIVEVEHRLLSQPRLVVQCELLLLEER